MKRFLIYLRLEMKKGMKLIPFFLLSFFITAAAVFAAAAAVSLAMGRQSVLPKAEVAVVAGSDGSDDSVDTEGNLDFKTMMMIGVVQSMESVKSICHFSYMSPKEAADGLKNGSVQAAVYLPDGVYEDINNGMNTPVKVRLSNGGSSFLSGLFRGLVNAGVKLIETVETAIYSVDYLSETYPLKDELTTIEDTIFSAYVAGALARGGVWKSENISTAFGSLTLPEFYAAGAVLLILLLLGAGFLVFYTPGEQETQRVLGRKGLPIPASSAAKIVTALLVFFVFSLLLTYGAVWILHLFFPETYGMPAVSGIFGIIPRLLPASFLAACFIHLVYSVVPEKGAGLVCLLVSLLIFLLGGGLVPSAYLPGFLRAAAPYSPSAAAQSLIGGAILHLANGSEGPCTPAVLRALAVSLAMLVPPLLLHLTDAKARIMDRRETAKRDELMQGASAPKAGPHTGSAYSALKAGGPSPAGAAFLRFRVLFAGELKNPAFLALTAAAVLLLIVMKFTVIPTASLNRIGLVNGGGGYAALTAEELLKNEGIYEYVSYPDEEALKEAVTGGKADCGFILGPAIDEAVQDSGWKKDGKVSVPELKECIGYIYTTSTTKGEAAKEEVFSALFGHLSGEIMRAAVEGGAIFKEADREMADAVLAEMARIEESGETFDVAYEEIGNAQRSAGKGLLWPAAALLVFASALFLAQAKFNPEQAAVAEYLRGAGFLYRTTAVLAPLLAMTLVLAAFAAFLSGNLVPHALLLFPLAAVFAVCAAFFTGLFRNRSICLFVSTAVILLASVVLII